MRGGCEECGPHLHIVKLAEAAVYYHIRIEIKHAVKLARKIFRRKNAIVHLTRIAVGGGRIGKAVLSHAHKVYFPAVADDAARICKVVFGESAVHHVYAEAPGGIRGEERVEHGGKVRQVVAVYRYKNVHRSCLHDCFLSITAQAASEHTPSREFTVRDIQKRGEVGSCALMPMSGIVTIAGSMPSMHAAR